VRLKRGHQHDSGDEQHPSCIFALFQCSISSTLVVIGGFSRENFISPEPTCFYAAYKEEVNCRVLAIPEVLDSGFL
jgi:hypothetical protein